MENKAKPNNSSFGWKLQSLRCSFLATQERHMPRAAPLCYTPSSSASPRWKAGYLPSLPAKNRSPGQVLTGGPKATGALGTTLFNSFTSQRKRVRLSKHAAHLGLLPPASAPSSFLPGFQYRRGWTPRQMAYFWRWQSFPLPLLPK